MSDNKEFLRISAANAEKIDRQIRMLDPAGWSPAQQRDYNDFWDLAQKVLQLFRTVGPLSSQDRKLLWQRFDNVCKNAREKQQEDDEKRKLHSEKLKGWIIGETEKARPPDRGLPDERQFKDMSDALSHVAFLFSKYKQKMLGNHRLECLARLEEVEKQFKLCRQKVKEDRLKRHKAAHLQVGENLKQNRARWNHAKEGLHRLQNYAEELRQQIGEANNPVFRHRLQNKLVETEEKIRNTRYSMQQIKSWIEADKKKFRRDQAIRINKPAKSNITLPKKPKRLNKQ